MKKLILWLFSLAVAISGLITVAVVICLWFLLGDQQIEFELTFSDIMLMFAGISFLLSGCLFIIFYKPLNDLKKLVSENPFHEFGLSSKKSFNPFVSIKNSIKKNNDKSNSELERLTMLSNTAANISIMYRMN